MLLALAGLLVCAVGAQANPTIDEKRAQAEAILAEIQTLDEEVGAAAERFNGANYELGQLTAELEDTRDRLTAARRQNGIAQQRVAKRLRQLYINGSGPSTIEVVFGAASLDDVVDRIDVASRVVEQDSAIASQARTLRRQITVQERQVRASRERQAEVVEERAAERRWIEGKLAEREQLLSSVKDEIARLQEEERRRQAELQRQAELELQRQQAAAAAATQTREQAATAASTQTQSITLPSDDDAGGDESSVPVEPPPAYIAPPADASRGAQVVAIAMQYLGIPYRWGGSSPSTGFDCSGFTSYVFAQVGISLPHHAASQYGYGMPVAQGDLQPGDLVFFSGLGHMGMYIGGGNFIHAPQTGDVVKISSVADRGDNYVGARRVL